MTFGSVVAAVSIASATPALADTLISTNTTGGLSNLQYYLWSAPSTVTVTGATVQTNQPSTGDTLVLHAGGPGAVGAALGTLTYSSLVAGTSVTLSGNVTVPAGNVWVYIGLVHSSANPGVNVGTWTPAGGTGTGAYSSGGGLTYFDATGFVGTLTLTGQGQTTPPATAASATPGPIVQEVGNPTGQACSSTNLPEVTPGAPDGGWQPSWSQWPNSGKGGSVCSRTLVFRNGAWSTSPGN